jgi:membrane fusion protein (multidrug efflux system)
MVLGGVALVAAGAVYYVAVEGLPVLPGGPAPQAATRPAQSTVAVEAEQVTVGPVVEDIRTVGSLLPNEVVVVSPEIAGRVARIGFAEGDRVAAGEVLVELDPTILRAELAKARSDLGLARANHQRAMTLASQGIGTLRARDEAIAALQAEEANVALAEARLGKASIAAPFAGVVGLRSISVGAYVTPGERIVELTAFDPIKVDFRVPELALASLRTGQAIEVTLDALPGRAFTGEVYAIDPVVDAGGRAVRVRARVPNGDGALSPGLFARIRIVVERREGAMLVPESSIFAEGSKTLVFRVVDGRAVRSEVVLGQRRPGQVEVVRGLGAGDVVVTAGHQQVRDGVRVEVVASGRGA